MGNFMGNFYCCFQGLFGDNLADYLWGFDCETQTYANSNLFFSIGLCTLAIVALSVIIYYFIWGSVRWIRGWQWALYGLGVSLVCLLLAFLWTNSNLSNGLIGDCLVFNESGNQIITSENCLGFGVANLIISFVEFFVLSIILKRWGAGGTRNTPWNSLWPK